jgi:hypothetical protein
MFLRLLTAAAVALHLIGSLASAETFAGTCQGEDLIAGLAADKRAALEAAVAQHPYPSGIAWRAEKDGSSVTVIGTMHIFDDRMMPIIEALSPAIVAADAVYLEATDAEMGQLQSELGRNPDLLVIGPGAPTLPEQLTPEEWAQVSAELSARGIPPFMASKFRPWYVTMMLGMPACAVQAMAAGDKGLDGLLMEVAGEFGVPMYALEPYDTALRLFEMFSEEEQVEMIRIYLPFAAKAEHMFATMLNAYFREDHRMIWELTRLSIEDVPAEQRDKARADFGVMEGALLVSRNRAWMEVILPAAAGRDIVVAVGAAHLSGVDGVLNSLAEAGYSLERIPL